MRTMWSVSFRGQSYMELREYEEVVIVGTNIGPVGLVIQPMYLQLLGHLLERNLMPQIAQ